MDIIEAAEKKKTKNAEYQRKWREANKDTNRERQKQYMRDGASSDAGRLARNEYMRLYRLKQKEKLKEALDKVTPPHEKIKETVQVNQNRVMTRQQTLKEQINKPVKIVETPIEVVEVPKSKNKKNKNKKKKINDKIQYEKPVIINELKESTIKAYITKVSRVIVLLTEDTVSTQFKSELKKCFNNRAFDKALIIEELRFFKDDFDNVLEFIKLEFRTANTLNAYLIALTSLMSRIKELNDVYRKLSTISTNISKEYQEKRDEQVMDEKRAKIIMDLMDKSQMEDRIEKTTNNEDKLLLMIFMENIRRMSDIRTLIISKKESKTENVVLMSPTFVPIKFIFKEYKTNKSYHTQKENISPRIRDLILKIIKDKNKKQNDYLFSLTEGRNREEIANSNFSERLKKLKIPNTIVRQAQSKEINDNVNLSLAKKKELIEKKSQHSYNTSQQYNVSFVKLDSTGEIIPFSEYVKMNK